MIEFDYKLDYKKLDFTDKEVIEYEKTFLSG